MVFCHFYFCGPQKRSYVAETPKYATKKYKEIGSFTLLKEKYYKKIEKGRFSKIILFWWSPKRRDPKICNKICVQRDRFFHQKIEKGRFSKII